MTVCGGIVLACRSFIPDENLVFCQEFLMRQIISNIHYAPETWLQEAHSSNFSPVLSSLVLLFR
jgi:autophagy-related protein 9